LAPWIVSKLTDGFRGVGSLDRRSSSCRNASSVMDAIFIRPA